MSYAATIRRLRLAGFRSERKTADGLVMRWDPPWGGKPSRLRVTPSGLVTTARGPVSVPNGGSAR